MEKYYKKVEEVLNIFDEECGFNYYENKKTVVFEQNESDVISGSYDDELNVIEYSNEEPIVHELFHMCFRNKEKRGKPLYEGAEYFCGNGVSFYNYKEGNKNIYARGINEGFANYLTRKCAPIKSGIFELYFTDLLISIYGEDIVRYALKNDPVGFLREKRFYDINKFIANLDSFYDAKSSLVIINKFQDVFKNPPKDKKEAKEIYQLLIRIGIKYKKTIINLFKHIINEFNNCDCPNISKEEFSNKLSRFLLDSNYLVAFAIDNSECSVKEELTNIIAEFKNSKEKVKVY